MANSKMKIVKKKHRKRKSRENQKKREQLRNAKKSTLRSMISNRISVPKDLEEKL